MIKLSPICDCGKEAETTKRFLWRQILHMECRPCNETQIIYLLIKTLQRIKNKNRRYYMATKLSQTFQALDLTKRFNNLHH